jgi:hypothetical protein
VTTNQKKGSTTNFFRPKLLLHGLISTTISLHCRFKAINWSSGELSTPFCFLHNVVRHNSLTEARTKIKFSAHHCINIQGWQKPGLKKKTSPVVFFCFFLFFFWVLLGILGFYWGLLGFLSFRLIKSIFLPVFVLFNYLVADDLKIKCMNLCGCQKKIHKPIW